MSTYDDEEYHVSLVDQRVFGAGLKRKRIAFVPAVSEEPLVPTQQATKQNAGDRYLSIVLKTNETQTLAEANKQATKDTNADLHDTNQAEATCPVCGQANTDNNTLARSHETSIAHQLCLEHSHQPSHLDRSRVGLKYLQDYGWDPDARTGLGLRSEGIRIPIKVKKKDDSAGLGISQDDEDYRTTTRKKQRPKPEEKVNTSNAKDVRRAEQEKSRKAERLRKEVYGPDLSQYLGPQG